MVFHPYKPAPQERRSSNPTWSSQAQPTALFTPSKSALKTSYKGTSNPRTTGLPKARASPYMTPNSTRVTLKNGQTRPMELFQPKDLQGLKAMQALRRNEASPTSTRGQARVFERKPKFIAFPHKSEVDNGDPSPKPVSPPMQGTPRQVERPRDRTRPTVQLLSVMKKCWDDDSMKDFDYAMTNGLLNGRNEERDRSRMWGELGRAVYKIWRRELGDWIMCYAPSLSEYDSNYLNSKETCSGRDGGYTCDLHLATKDSSLDRVGFYMTGDIYDAACNIVQTLAKQDSNLWCLLHNNINPFFVIYACADCNVPLPIDFNRKLLWHHLDAILRAKCWRGLGSGRYTTRASASANQSHGNHIPPKFLRTRMGEDPEGILQSLMRLSYNGDSLDLPPAPTAFDDEARGPVLRLSITIEDYKWVVKAGAAGTIWYQAGDLLDEDDIACFAVIDALTRLLPSCQHGILEISTDHIHALWGVRRGPPPASGSGSGAWAVVQAICNQYQVRLRGSWTKDRGPDPCEKILQKDIAVPPRDSKVVDAVLDAFKQNGLDDGKAAYRCMMNHLVPSQDRPY